MLIICFVFLLRRKLTLIHCCLLSSVLQQEMVYQLRAWPPFSLPPPHIRAFMGYGRVQTYDYLFN